MSATVGPTDIRFDSMSENLYAFFKTRFPDDGRKTALSTPQGRTFSYAALDRATARFGNALLSCGLRPGDRVAVRVDKSPEAIILYLACVRAGLVYVPLNTAYQADERRQLLADCEPALIVCRPGDEAGKTAIETLDAGGGGSLADRAAIADDVLAPRPVDANDPAVLLYTSGTTGTPKGAIMSHAQIAARAAALVDVWGWRADDVLLHAMPIFHTHGLFMSLSGALASNAHTILLPRFTIEEVLAHLPHATVFTGVPTLYARLLASGGLNAETCRRMRVFLCGSAALPPDVFHAFAERTGHQIIECWGMTELPTCASNPLDGERRPGTVGRVVAGTEVRIVDDDGGPVPPATVGRIEVRTRPRFAGYWRRPEETRAAFRPDGFFVTGDLGQFSDDGYLSIVGRISDVIISGGYNVYPREIEAVLRTIDGIADAAVIGLAHPDFGEGVTAVVEGTEVPDEAAIIAALRRRLAAFKVPKRVIAVAGLPRNETGKVLKAELRRNLCDLYGASPAPKRPVAAG